MKRVGRLIDIELRRQGITARQMAVKMKLDPALLSRIRSGESQDVEAKTLMFMQKGISSDGAVQAQLLLAYLGDKLEGNPIASRITFQLLGEVEAKPILYMEGKEPIKPGTTMDIENGCEKFGLDSHAAKAVKSLVALMPTNRRLRNLVVSLAGYAVGK